MLRKLQASAKTEKKKKKVNKKQKKKNNAQQMKKCHLKKWIKREPKRDEEGWRRG